MAEVLYKPYASLAQVQAELRNSRVDETDRITRAINEASRWIEEHCNTDFWRHDHSASALVVRKEWLAGEEIHLPYPIESLTAVNIIDTDAGTTDVQVLNEDYWLDSGMEDSRISRFGVITLSHSPSTDRLVERVELLGVFGTTLTASDPTANKPTNLPGAVNRACVITAAAMSGLMEKVHVNQGNPADQTAIYDTRIPREALMLLKRWRIYAT